MFTRPTTAAVGAMKASTAVSGVWSNTVNSDLCRLSAEQTRSGVTGQRQGAPGRGCPQGAQAMPGERGTHNIRTAPAASHRCPHTPPAPTGPAPPSSQDSGTQRRAAPPGGPAAGARAPGHTTGATRASEGERGRRRLGRRGHAAVENAAERPWLQIRMAMEAYLLAHASPDGQPHVNYGSPGLAPTPAVKQLYRGGYL